MYHEYMIFIYIFLMIAPLFAELISKIKVDGVVLKIRMLLIVVGATLAATGRTAGEDILVTVLAIRYLDKIMYYLFFCKQK